MFEGVKSEMLTKKYRDIRAVDEEGITFVDGDMIVFRECIRKRYDSSTCIAEREREQDEYSI